MSYFLRRQRGLWSLEAASWNVDPRHRGNGSDWHGSTLQIGPTVKNVAQTKNETRRRSHAALPFLFITYLFVMNS